MAATVKRQGDMILIGANVRIEQGPPMVTAKATAELLADAKTASHYAVGKRDALGKPIVLGEDFTYLDWGGNDAEGKRVYYVFEKVDIPEAERNAAGAETTDEFRWIERGTRASEEAAISFGQTIAGA
jgi:hypothetical protein